MVCRRIMRVLFDVCRHALLLHENRLPKGFGRCAPALREARYFAKNIGKVTNVYEILGDIVLRKVVTTALGLPERTIFFALVIDSIPLKEQIRAIPVVTMPAAIQDISLYVPENIPAAEVMESLRSGAGELLEEIRLFDRFQKEGDNKVSLAFTLTFRSSERTLTSEEVSALRESAGAEAVRRCGAQIRG